MVDKKIKHRRRDFGSELSTGIPEVNRAAGPSVTSEMLREGSECGSPSQTSAVGVGSKPGMLIWTVGTANGRTLRDGLLHINR